MAKARRSAEEIAAMMAGYQQSGQTRQEYCRQRDIALSTFDYYRQRRKAPKVPAGFVAVTMEAVNSPLTIVLRNGRRVEVVGGFAEEELTRVLRVAERN